MFLALLLALTPSLQEPILIREVLAIESLGQRSRSPVNTDALEAALARGTWEAPSAGDTMRATTGDERAWTAFSAAEDGWFSGAPFSGGWAYARVDVPAGGAWCLDASGHSFVLVDGEPRAGDVYGLGITRAPMALGAGTHELLFRCGRGRLRATLEPAPAPIYFEERDRTLPDVLRGQAATMWAGVIVSNATSEAARGLSIVARVDQRSEVTTSLALLGPSSYRKVSVAIEVPGRAQGDELEVQLALTAADGRVLHESSLVLPVRSPHDKHARTFVSAIDGSVQYFAVTPPSEKKGGPRPAMFLSLHGAGVEARGQANCYAPKDWGVVVAPTNRRPFGFDWEDWGRLDALEVLGLGEELFGTDPARTYLTGHSMGGHGAWQLGAHFPDRFAAIAPSAGWRDFWGYGGAKPIDVDDPVGAFLGRAANSSRTLLLERNYLSSGVYVLHGDADTTVPVDQARTMRSRLAAFHPNFAYYERPGAGHWWGNECMDWPPLFRFLRENVLPAPASLTEIEFTTVNPAISSRCHWVTIEAQEHSLEPSRVRVKLIAGERRVDVDASNVTRLALDLSAFTTTRGDEEEPMLAPGEPVVVRLGETEISCQFTDPTVPLVLGRGGEGGWTQSGPLAAWYKGPHRAGPFKDAFRHGMLSVYGTAGTPEENAWCHAKARFDHETWRYRGNGAVDVVADTDFEPEKYPDRAVILYGNQDTNSAWSSVLGSGAFELRRDWLRVGAERVEGDDLALLAVYPRRDSDVACVAVIGGTGLPGCRTTDHLPYFVSGVAYPDWTVIGTEQLSEGLAGIRGAGFFRADWSTEEGAEAVWR